MKAVLQSLQNQPCREREISDNEKTNFANYLHLQRYHPALDLFTIPESILSHKNVELPSKYYISNWNDLDENQTKIWNSIRTSDGSDSENTKTFVKTVHLLNPIDLIKEKYIIPEHPLLPQSENTWKKTLLKLHSHNNQAYVDTVANYVFSRFRELDLTPHCVLYYGATTGISKNYQFNISQEYDTYRQCKWFWKGMKSHSARLTVLRGDADLEEIPNFEEIYNDIVTCPFDDTESEDLEVELEPLESSNDESHSDLESIKSFTFDTIEENAENVKDIFEINKKIVRKGSVKSNSSKSSCTSSDSESNEESNEETDEDSEEESIELDLDICLEIPNMPVILIYQEAQDGVMDSLLDEDEIDGYSKL
jgi:hypothetical protein